MLHTFSSLHSKVAFLVFVSLFLSAFYVVSAYYVYPAPGGDSLFYTQPAVNLASGQGLRIPLFNDEQYMDNKIDLTGQRRYLQFPPLQPLLIGYVMQLPTPQGAFLAIALINIAVIFLSSIVLYKAATVDKPLTWFSVLLISLCLFGIASTIDQEGGRPEILARLFLVSALVSILYINPKYHWLTLGVLLGLLGATHPMGSLIIGSLLIMFFGVKYGYKKALTYTFGSSLASLLIFVAVMKISPFGITEKLDAMRKIGTASAASFIENEALNPKLFFNHYVVDPGAPFLIFIVILSFVGAAAVYIKKRKCIHSSLLFLLGSLIFLTILAWLMFYIVGHQFYVAILSPLLFGTIVYYATKKGLLVKTLTIIIVLLSTLGIVRNLIFFPTFLKRGLELDGVRLKFKEAQIRYGRQAYFGVTGSLWTLSEDYKQMYTYDFWPEIPKKNTTAIFWQQAYSGALAPPDIQGCNLAENHFNEPLKIFGLKFGNSLRDYAYALYECNAGAEKTPT